MKEFFLSLSKYLLYLVAFGWTAHVYFVSTIEAQVDGKIEHLEKVKDADLKGIHKRLDRIESQNDIIINQLIKEKK